MIDTIKLSLNLNNIQFKKLSDNFKINHSSNKGICKYFINPTNLDRKNGTYTPRLTYIERPSNGSKLSEVLIEFSVPKLLFGNNFEEVSEDFFPQTCVKLSNFLCEKGLFVSPEQIAKFEIRKIDFCKNIPLENIFPSSIIGYISKGDFSLRKDIQRTDFRNGGQILHIHTNSVDIALYDKIADIKQSAISEKRSFEKDYYSQRFILENINKLPQFLRFEVRLNSKRVIKNLLKTDSKIYFEDIFKDDLSRKILLKYWHEITEKIPKSQIDSNSPFSNLINSTTTEQAVKPLSVLAKIGLQAIIAENGDLRQIRNIFDKRFGLHAWSRIKTLISPINGYHLKELLNIEKQIKSGSRISLNNFDLVK